jgi:hypothetical protein
VEAHGTHTYFIVNDVDGIVDELRGLIGTG